MRKALLVFGILVSFAAPADAQEVQFIGGLSIYAQAGSCPNGNNVGKHYLARFRPRNASLDTPHSDLNLYAQSSALGHRLLNGLFAPAFKKVQATFMGGGSGTTPVAQSVTSISFASQEPASITGATKSVDIDGKIRGFDSQPNCTVSFQLSAARRFDF